MRPALPPRTEAREHDSRERWPEGPDEDQGESQGGGVWPREDRRRDPQAPRNDVGQHEEDDEPIPALSRSEASTRSEHAPQDTGDCFCWQKPVHSIRCSRLEKGERVPLGDNTEGQRSEEVMRASPKVRPASPVGDERFGVVASLVSERLEARKLPKRATWWREGRR